MHVIPLTFLATIWVWPLVLFYTLEPERVMLFVRIFVAVCRGLLRYVGIYV